MSEEPTPRPPEADLPGTDPEFRRPVSWRSAGLIIAAALVVPVLVGRCVWHGVGGTPSPRVRAPASPVVFPRPADRDAPAERASLDTILRLQQQSGRAAALAAFETSVAPFQPSPLEWTYYVAMAQDEGRTEAVNRGLSALEQMSVELWRLPLLRGRQAMRGGDLDRAWREMVTATEALRESPEQMIPLAEEMMGGVAGALLLAHRPREAALILPERLVATQPTLFRLRLQALMMSGRADEAEAWLQGDSTHFSAGERQRLLAAARWADNRPAAAAVAWDEGFTLAERHGNDTETLGLAVAARLGGDRTRARRAFAVAWDSPAGRLVGVEAWTDFVSLLVEQEDLAAAATWAGRLRERFPDSAVARNNALYLSLALGVVSDAELAAARADPAGLGPATLALAALRAGQGEAAESYLDDQGAAGLAVRSLWWRAQGRPREAEAAAQAALAAPDVTAIERRLLQQ